MSEQFTLEQLLITKVSIKNIDISKELIHLIEIFESLQQPGITGTIDFADFQGLYELGNIVAGDELQLDFSVNGKEGLALTLKFSIYSCEGNRVLPEHTYNVTRFGFCSPWLVEGLTLKVSKNYTEKFIHEIIKDLLEAAGAQVGYIEPTKQKLDMFVTPLWSPYRSIKYLMSLALNAAEQGGYICWTDLKTGKVNVTTLNYLNVGTLGKFKEFTIYPGNLRYEGRINNMTIETNFDIVRMLNNGITHKHLTFSFDKGKHIMFEDTHSKNKYTHLSKKFPADVKYAEKKYEFQKYTSDYPQSRTAITDENVVLDILKGASTSEHTFLTADVIKINILTVGEPERRVGWLAEVDFPSQNINTPGAENSKTGNKQFKGDYLIRDIRHMFSFQSEYKQAITLVSDGMKESDRNLITWS